MHKTQAKRRRDIKNKLMAAICMLLVSSIMMVSTTYAWFTLSTAPEVTGINTAVGANGNLEMALLPKDGELSSITSEAGDSTKDIEEKNVTWGNLVDLSDSTIYGLNKITLFPSELNEDEATNTIGTTLLKTPTYGADGRIDKLTPNTVTGYFDKQNESFSPNTDFGVRAVGTASGMTDRQLDYRNARSAANTARAQAANLASQSLNNNGSSLANIAIEYGMGADTAEFTQTDVASLRKIVDDLQKADGILKTIERAYLQYILAYGASDATGTEDTVWSAVKGLVNADGATLESVMNGLTGAGMTAPEALTTAIGKYNGTVTAVSTADTKLKELEAAGADAKFTWEQIRAAMEPLANPASMTINGFKANEVKQNLGELVSSVTAQGGLMVTMGTGAGVYADIADQCGNYTASITIEKVEYNGIVLNNMQARMETKTSVNPVYLTAIGAAVEGAGAPASGATGTLPITDMYGYVIDLAFRTNAAESKLLLQVDAADRIYEGNTNEQTMGHGSSMTFAATTTDFTNDQVKSLMSAIRIVFFDTTNNNTIVARAKLDVANATLGTDGITAKMYLYKMTDGSGYTEADYDANATGVEYYTLATTYTALTDADAKVYEGQLYTSSGENTYAEATYAEGNADNHYFKRVDTYSKYTDTAAPSDGTQLYVKQAAGEQKLTDNAIMALTQNTAHALSVLVYLDGNLVGNDDVAATNATSMTGKMNLQFASSANLVPMEYAALHIPGAGNGDDDQTTTYNVTVPTGVTGNATAAAGADYTFTVATGYTLGTVTVGGTTVTPNAGANGAYTIPAASVTGDIVITVTANP